MPRDANGQKLVIGDVVIHERRSKLTGVVSFVYRGRIVRIDGQMVTVRLNEKPHGLRSEPAQTVRRYLALVRQNLSP